YRPWVESYASCVLSYAHHLKRLTLEMADFFPTQRRNILPPLAPNENQKNLENAFYNAKRNWESALKKFHKTIIQESHYLISNSDEKNEPFLRKIWEEKSLFTEVEYFFYVFFLHECFKDYLEKCESIHQAPLLHFMKLILSYKKTHSEEFSPERDRLCEMWFQKASKSRTASNQKNKLSY